MKIKYYLLLVIAACVIVFACRKVELHSDSSANSQLVDAARKWFEEKHANDIATIRGFVANGRLTSRVKNVFAGEPDWKLARPYMGNLGILVVLDSRNDRKGHVMYRDLLITKDSSGGFKEYIQSVYFDSAYISSLVAGKGKLADIRSYSDPGTFTGRVILTTVYNQLVRGAVFENGQLVKGIEPTARALRNKKINPAPTVNLYSSVPGSAITPVGVDIGTGGDLDDNNGDGGGSWNDNGDNTAGPDVNVTADPKPTLPPGTGPVINPPLPDPGNYSPTIPPNYGGGGGGYAQQPKPQQDTTPCGKAKTAVMKADTIFGDSSVRSSVGKLSNVAANKNEQGFAIYQKLKYASDDNNAPLVPDYDYTGSIQNGGTNDVSISYDTYPAGSATEFLGTLHTHPPASYSAPSAADIYGIIESELNNPGTQTNFVDAADGDVYALQVTDTAAARTFYTTKGAYLNTTTNGWLDGTDIGSAFNAATQYYQKLDNNESNVNNLAYEMAMSAMLSSYNTGVTLMKQDKSTGNFQPIMQNVSKSLDSKGKVTTSYSDAGCPN